MTFSPKLAVIALKHKKEECYRPISLTNTDYKNDNINFCFLDYKPLFQNKLVMSKQHM